jgi:hypothetical protein
MEIWLIGQPESLVLELLRNIRADVARLDEKIDAKVDSAKAEFRSEIQSLRADVAADFIAVRKEMGSRSPGWRRAVVEYHSAVLGPTARSSASSRRACGASRAISIFQHWTRGQVFLYVPYPGRARHRQ